MKAKFLLCATLLCALLSGCELLCQAGTGTCGMSKEQRERLLNPKAYGEHWVKEGVTVDQKRADSWACGAARTTLAADQVVFSPEALKSERRAEDKDDFAPRTRLTKAWITCMESKGYRYQQ